jgi:serine/threonine protein kinase
MKPLPDQRRWQIISLIFDRVIDLPREQRLAVIEQLAGEDAEVVSEVVSLILAHDRSSDFLETRADLNISDLSLVLDAWKASESGDVTDKQPPLSREPRPSNSQEETNRDQSTATHTGASRRFETFAKMASDLKQIRPDYDILGFAGEGGSAIVFRALDRRLNREVALKVLRSNWAEKMGADYLDREARAGSLVSDHFVRVYEVAPRDSNLPFLVLEWIDGPSLRNVVSQQHAIPPREAARIAREIATALAIAHASGLAHGDVKPANVLLERKSASDLLDPANLGRTKVTDFGLANRVDGYEVMKRSRFAGTPAYASPEQLLDNHFASPASDIWSLGATLYQMLVGTPPYSGAPHAIARQMQQGEPARPRSLDSRIPRDLESICMKALSKNPEMRYANGREMADDLERFLQGLPVKARPITLPLHAIRAVRRQPIVWGLATLAISFLIAGFLISNYFRLRAEQHLATSKQHLATAQQNSDLAQQRLASAMETVDRFFVTVSENRLLNEPGLQELRMELLREALPHLKTLAESAPDVTKPSAEWARVVYRLALLENSVDGPDAALQTILKATPVVEQLVAQHPDRDDLFEQWINTLMVAGIAYENKLDFADSELTWQRMESLCAMRPHPHQALMLGRLYLNWAKNHGTMGNLDSSLALNAKGIELINQAIELEPTSEDAKSCAATLHGNRGMTLISLSMQFRDRRSIARDIMLRLPITAEVVCSLISTI